MIYEKTVYFEPTSLKRHRHTSKGFVYDPSCKEKAELLSSKSNKFVKFRWLDDSEDQDKCFFEIKIVVDEITKDVSLMVSDFSYEDEVEETKMLWESQISDLKQDLGSS